MRRCGALAILLLLFNTGCPLQLDAKEHHGQLWQHQVEGAQGFYMGQPNLPVAITDENGRPVWGGACVCPGAHLIYQQFREGEIPANSVTEDVDEGIDLGATKTCENYAEEATMDSNNCEEAVAALTEPPVHRGPCSFWASTDHCDVVFDETGGEGETETETTGEDRPLPDFPGG